MGNESSVYRQHAEDLEFKTPFNRREMKWLWKKFKKVAQGKDEIDPRHFRKFLNLDASYGLLFNRIFEDVDTTGDNAIGFDEFVMAHAKLGRGKLRDKLLYIFSVFDTDGDGKLEKDEAVELIRSMSSSFARFIIAIYNNPSDPRSPSHVKRKKDKAKVGSCLARHALSGGDQQLDDALSSFYNKADKDGDESIDRNEFVSFLKQFPKAFSILEKFEVPELKEYETPSTFYDGGGAYATY